MVLTSRDLLSIDLSHNGSLLSTARRIHSVSLVDLCGRLPEEVTHFPGLLVAPVGSGSLPHPEL